MEQQKVEEKGLRRFYAENILRNRFGMKSNLSDVLSTFIIDFYDKFFNDFDYEKVKHIRNAQSNMGIAPVTPDTIHKITFTVSLMDKDTLKYHYSKEEAIKIIIDTIGDCTISECIGCYKGRQMKSLQIIKFLKEKIPQNYVYINAKKLKTIFNQESIITEIFDSYQISFNDYSKEYENEVNMIMQEYDMNWDEAVMAFESGLA